MIIAFIAQILLIIKNFSNFTRSVVGSLTSALSFRAKSVYSALSLPRFWHLLPWKSRSARRVVKIRHRRSQSILIRLLNRYIFRFVRLIVKVIPLFLSIVFQRLLYEFHSTLSLLNIWISAIHVIRMRVELACRIEGGPSCRQSFLMREHIRLIDWWTLINMHGNLIIE